MEVEGLRWQQTVLGVRPRFCWAIDVCGTHAQMPQICRGLGLDGLVMCRPFSDRPTIFCYESADGTKVLPLVPRASTDLPQLLRATKDLTPDELKAVDPGE